MRFEVGPQRRNQPANLGELLVPIFVHRQHAFGERVDDRELFVEIPVMGRDDVACECGWLEHRPVGRGLRRHVERSELGRQIVDVELARRARLVESAIAMAAVVEPEALEYIRGGRVPGDEFAESRLMSLGHDRPR